MNFDKRWLQFEITHGPQSPGAKEDALFWFNAGSSAPTTVIDELNHKIEELQAELSECNSESPAS